MANEQTKGAGAPVTLRDRFLIFPGTPLPEFSTESAQAFNAEDKRDAKKGYFALIVRPGYPARTDAMRAMKGVQCPGLMTLAEWGVADWPLAGRKVMVVVYEKPLGGRVMPLQATEFKKIEEKDLVRTVITPVVAAFKELRGRSITHRAIRPSNMFWATPDRSRVLLGDYTTCPPGMEQPALLETIEMGLSQPAGRGDGETSNDYYSFGAAIVLMLLGRYPMAGQSDEAVVLRKIQQGSYAVLVGDERLPLHTIELLRGLLCDVAEDRWNNEALDLWLAGRRLPPLLTKTEKRAARGLVISGKEYYTSRELAVAFSKEWDAAIPLVVDGRLELWLRRSLDQPEKANAVAMVMAAAAAAAAERKPATDIMLAKVCLILDSHAPIRYKGLAAMPEGFGGILAITMVEGGAVRILAEAVQREIFKAWLETREGYRVENSSIENRLRQIKSFLDRGTLGLGIERALYDLNDSLPCISPLVVDSYALDIKDLLPAMETATKKLEFDGKSSPIDRHIAAFIGARANFEVDRFMMELAEPNPERALLGAFNLLATIQWRTGASSLPGLCTWLANLAQPIINSYHNREKRSELEREIPKLAKSGNLVEVMRVLDNRDARMTDQHEFERARAEWADAAAELREIKDGHLRKNEEAIILSQQLASLISVTISLITITLLLIGKFL